jgi:hypothetical protein
LEIIMTLELVLDIILSVIVLAIYHSDCHSTSPEAYDPIVPTLTPEPIDEWELEDEALLDEWVPIVEPIDEWVLEDEALLDVDIVDIYVPSLAGYQALSARKLKAMARELHLPGWSRMSQPKLAVSVYEATIARDYPDNF